MWLGLEGYEPVALAGDVSSDGCRQDLGVTASADHDLWRRVDALIDRAPTDEDVRSHRLEVLAAPRYRQQQRPVPPDFAAQERFAAIASMTAPVVLERVRQAVDGPIIVIKGPEVAAFYPDIAVRGYGDVDLLVPNPAAVQEALLAAGFEEVGNPELYVDIHHLRPLIAPGMPLPVEVHSTPKWLAPLTAPPIEELLAVATAGTAAEGVLRLPPQHHAHVLALHSWAHEPLRRLRDIVDIAATMQHADRSATDRLARSWGAERLWRTTSAVVEALFAEGPSPAALRIWGRNLSAVRERTVLENHLQRLLSDFWAMPTGSALARVPSTIADEVRPGGEEGWRAKLSRTSLAFQHAAHRRSAHDQDVDRRRAHGGSADAPIAPSDEGNGA
jgi:hypothetical protein